MLGRLRKLRKFRLAVGLAVAATILNAFGWLSVTGTVQDSLRPISGPLTHAGQSLGSFLTDLAHIGSLASHNQQLEQQNQQLLTQLTNTKELERENQQLRAQLGFAKRASSAVIGADVIGFEPDGLEQHLLINRGKADGISLNMVVETGGQLVGKISQVNSHSAQVELASDEGFRALVLDQATRTPGIIKGRAGDSVVMERIPQNRSINNGDTIVTSGLEGIFPAGLIVGSVAGVSQDSQSIFRTAQIHQNFSLADLRIVMVLGRNE